MTPEITNNPLQPTDSINSTDSIDSKHSTLLPAPKLRQAGNSLSTFLFYLSILFFFIGFNFSDVMVGNWFQQFMPNINNRPISDITFLDSLTGFAVTPYTANDTAYILKTTNGGDSWNRVFTGPTNSIGGFNRVQFLNLNTGYVCGNFLRKTTNSGMNWFTVNTSGIFPENMYVISEDTIWLTDSESLTGGVFFTSNGGASWQNQLFLGSQNPTKIYMYNARIGFISENNGSQGYVRKTTDGGANWTLIVSNDYYLDIYFADSLLGWKSSAFGFKKTTDGGLNWVTQTLPSGGLIQTNGGLSFSNINRDTIWSSGGYLLYPNNTTHGFLNRTTNGGDTWYFQIPDTSLRYVGGFINFVNKSYGWATSTYGGIHTTNGGDTIFYLGIVQTSNSIPKDFALKQNYPNPFNPRTVIPYSIKSSAYVKLIAYDILGRENQKLVDEHQPAGEYEVDFIGKFASSGVYFYRIEVTDDNTKQLFTETKKMVLIK